jgi:hypothetical protein
MGSFLGEGFGESGAGASGDSELEDPPFLGVIFGEEVE